MRPTASASPEHSPATFVAGVGLIAAIASFCLFAANDFDRRSIHWGRMQALLMFVLPIVPGVLMLLRRRSRSLGIAYAAGIGTVATLALALLGYALSMLVVSVSSWKAHRGLAKGRQWRLAMTIQIMAT